jgi:polyhydroxyalkanoate synthesis regulator protein
MEIITKYKNRKLYSKELSKYVNLNYLLDLVNTNSSFLVLEHNTKKDVTNNTLSEAILKLNPKREDLIELIKRSI